MAFAKMHKRFYEIVRDANFQLPEKFEFNALEAIVVCEKILLSGPREMIREIIWFVDNIKELIHSKKIDVGKNLPSEDSHIAAEILGSFVPPTASIFAGRDKYLPFFLYAETPYHNLSVEKSDGAKINIGYDQNSPVIAIPAFYGSTDRP